MGQMPTFSTMDHSKCPKNAKIKSIRVALGSLFLRWFSADSKNLQTSTFTWLLNYLDFSWEIGFIQFVPSLVLKPALTLVQTLTIQPKDHRTICLQSWGPTFGRSDISESILAKRNQVIRLVFPIPPSSHLPQPEIPLRLWLLHRQQHPWNRVQIHRHHHQKLNNGAHLSRQEVLKTRRGILQYF